MTSSVSPSRTTCASLLRELQVPFLFLSRSLVFFSFLFPGEFRYFRRRKTEGFNWDISDFEFFQIIWDEIGESDDQRDKMLLQLEQECLDIYRRKVEMTRKHSAELHRYLADSKAQIKALALALGEVDSFSCGRGTLKDQLSALKPLLDELTLKKEKRVKEFSAVLSQIARISAEIAGTGVSGNVDDPGLDERDLSVKRLRELQSQLEELQSEKVLLGVLLLTHR